MLKLLYKTLYNTTTDVATIKNTKIKQKGD